MRIGILKADSVLPNLAPRFGEYTDMFPALLREADPSLSFAFFDVEKGEYPGTVDACDAYLITGSRHSTYDPLPWIPPLEDFVRRLDSERRKLIGVCFGHQLVARALGGRTGPATHGWTTGVQTARIEHPFPWAEEPSGEIRLIHCHKDQVLELPTEAEHVGGNELCPHAFFRIGNHVMTVQAHPEFLPEYARALYETRRETFGEETYQRAVESLEIGTDRPSFARSMASFLSTP